MYGGVNMDGRRILAVMGNTALFKKLKTALDRSGYQVIDQAKDGDDALRKMRYLKPDLAIIDYNLPVQNGFETAKIAAEDNLCGIILIVNKEQRDLIDCALSGYDFIIHAKPLDMYSFISTVDLVIKNRVRISALEKEVEELKSTLDSRKLIEKAKGILMKNMKLNEEQAFRMIQKQSMDRGIQMKEIAKAIILTHDL
jgi:two-component system, response regulator PdtaR